MNRWHKYGLIGLLVIGLTAFMLRPSTEVHSDDVRLCAWTRYAIDGPANQGLSGRVTDQGCEISSANYQAAVFWHQAPDDHLVNVPALKEHLEEITGVHGVPALYISGSQLASMPLTLFDNRVPIIVFSNENETEGYFVAEITDRLVLSGIWIAPQGDGIAQTYDAVQLRSNVHIIGQIDPVRILFEKYIQVFILIFFAIPQIGFLVFGGDILSRIERAWDGRAIEWILKFLAIPAAMLLWSWWCFNATAVSSASLVSVLTTLAALGLLARRTLSDRQRNRPLTPYLAENLAVFPLIKVTQSTTEILGVEHKNTPEVEALVWVPRRISCPHCHLKYAVYVSGEAKRDYRGTFPPKEIEESLRHELYVDAIKDAPQVKNPCIGCGKAIDETIHVKPKIRDEMFALNVKSVSLSILALAAAILIFLRGGVVVRAVEGIPIIGWLAGGLLDEFVGITITLLAVPGLYVGWKFFAGARDGYVMTSGRHIRMTACGNEGLIFEDLEMDRSLECPSCKGELKPIRHFRITGQSTTQLG